MRGLCVCGVQPPQPNPCTHTTHTTHTTLLFSLLPHSAFKNYAYAGKAHTKVGQATC